MAAWTVWVGSAGIVAIAGLGVAALPWRDRELHATMAAFAALARFGVEITTRVAHWAWGHRPQLDLRGGATPDLSVAHPATELAA